MPTRFHTTPGSRRISAYDPTLSANWANNLWADCPLQEFMHDPSIGILLDEQWNSYNAASTTGDYILTQSTAGSAAKSTTMQGVLSIDSGSTTVVQGANVQRAKSMFIPAAGKDIWAEFQVKFTGVGALNVETFIGLAEIDTSIIAASAVSTSNQIGWSSVTDDGVLLFDCEKATANATRAATTIVSDTWVRLGFKVNGVTSIQQYINGVETGTATATANVPIVALYPSFVCQSGGTDQPVMHLRPYRIFQLL